MKKKEEIFDAYFVSAPLDFSFFLPYNRERKKKETRKEGSDDVSIREPEYRI